MVPITMGWGGAWPCELLSRTAINCLFVLRRGRGLVSPPLYEPLSINSWSEARKASMVEVNEPELVKVTFG